MNVNVVLTFMIEALMDKIYMCWDVNNVMFKLEHKIIDLELSSSTWSATKIILKYNDMTGNTVEGIIAKGGG